MKPWIVHALSALLWFAVLVFAIISIQPGWFIVGSTFLAMCYAYMAAEERDEDE